MQRILRPAHAPDGPTDESAPARRVWRVSAILVVVGCAGALPATSASADLAVAKLTPIRAEILRLNGDPGFVDSVLAEGARKARLIAQPNMDAVKDIVGLVR